jgi:hypothetical protein
LSKKKKKTLLKGCITFAIYQMRITMAKVQFFSFIHAIQMLCHSGKKDSYIHYHVIVENKQKRIKNASKTGKINHREQGSNQERRLIIIVTTTVQRSTNRHVLVERWTFQQPICFYSVAAFSVTFSRYQNVIMLNSISTAHLISAGVLIQRDVTCQREVTLLDFETW